MEYRWFVDQVVEDQMHCYAIKKVLVDIVTPYQKVQIIENETFGKCLIIDGKIQSAEKDEYIYHESLIHPALILHNNPKKVLVIGAGEGASLRELLKYEGVEITAIEIDPEVVYFSEKYLWDWHKGAFGDPRVNLVYQDGWDYIKNCRDQYDVIILDLPEPYPNTPAYRLYLSDFYKMVWEVLGEDGILVSQADTTQLGQEHRHFWIRDNLKQVFTNTYSYQTVIPSFDSNWGFLIAGKGDLNPFLSKEELNNRIKTRIKKELKFYDTESHLSLFYLPKYLRNS
ncbi:MAG TPA: polyamine aminopropyltransferase [Dictyoglomaceae bacterium]|nr:polyamine aminopropyltransferase [Dictyoglomaceae bacterium]HOL39626.1 polyamine aminopropyltransferase [Dictyoglomaceae bacterium]HOP95152.1 polyamine aminopropyltransferase [Dictyoglomaceae bacterium]HPP15198.1 polyamine aminopropyltransferase [Dictyoglomaceae bacterium]HPU42604.1 polyamine aminopropyltransferase [Dictyoglomaceae bacterium]